MFKLFEYFRYTAYLAIVSSMAGALSMFYVGVAKAVKAIIRIKDISLNEVSVHDSLSASDLITADWIVVVDAMLIALVLLYFAFGVYVLYVCRPEDLERCREKRLAPEWMIPRHIGELKEVLGQVIIIILFVLFTRVAWENVYTEDWKILILPVSILLLSGSLKLLNMGSGHASED